MFTSNQQAGKGGALRLRPARVWQLLVALVTGVCLVLLPVFTVPSPTASADQRSDAQKQKEAAQRKQQELLSSLEGVSAQLGQAYLDLQAANAALSTAQGALDSAEATLAQRQREQQAATDRLNTAQAQLSKLQADSDSSRAQSADNRAAISSLVVSTYQGDNSLTSWSYVLASDSVAELTERASTMEVASGIQETVLSAAEAQRAQAANREARQNAATERVNHFKQLADAATQEAASAAQAAQTERDKVAAAQAKASSAASNLESQKQSMQGDLAKAQAAEASAQADIARIDAENRRAAQAAGTPVAPSGSTSVSGLGSGSIGHPIAGPLVVTSPWNPNRLHPVLGIRRPHEGVDLAASVGTPQYAAVSGTVIATNNYGSVGCGREVKINGGVIDGNSVVVRYCHLSAQQVRVGQRVTKGQQIGLTGATGGVTGPHCHFEVWLNGVSVNPMTLPGF